MRELARDESSYRAELDHPEDVTPCTCGNCGATWRYDQLAAIGDCCLTPGDASPAGRCADPSCDSLAYVDKAPGQIVVILDGGLVESIYYHGMDEPDSWVLDCDTDGADEIEEVKLDGHPVECCPPGGPVPTLLLERFAPPAEGGDCFASATFADQEGDVGTWSGNARDMEHAIALVERFNPGATKIDVKLSHG